ncbi:cation efflux protein [Xylariales sp. PMI_506]|nr:cation efflux protein [Xylariales sp. PMI_506]
MPPANSLRSKTSHCFVFIDVGLLVASLVFGIKQNSSMLVGDAFRKFLSAFAFFVQRWSSNQLGKPSSARYPYGFLRATVVATLFSSAMFIGLAGVLAVDALVRFVLPEDMIDPQIVLILSTISILQFILKSAIEWLLTRSPSPNKADVEGGQVSNPAVHAHDDAQTASNAGRHPNSVDTMNQAASISGSMSGTQNHDSDPLTPGIQLPQLARHRPQRLHILQSMEDFSIHPASFRQEIIAASRMHDDTESDSDFGSEEGAPITQETITPRRGSTPAPHRHTKGSKSETSKETMDNNAKKVWELGELFWAVGVMTASVVIWRYPHTSVEYIDPALALVASIIAIWYSAPVVQASANILLNAVPLDINMEDVREDLDSLNGVISAHHLRIWTLDGAKKIASVHLTTAFDTPEQWMELALQCRKVFHSYGIHSATVQPEFIRPYHDDIDDDDVLDQLDDEGCVSEGQVPTV